MYYYGKRLLMFLYGFRKFPSKKEIERSYQYYCNEVMDRDVINDNLTSEDYSRLLNMVQYLRGASGTAILAAFCLGFRAGKAV